jgi:hypothetical protein
VSILITFSKQSAFLEEYPYGEGLEGLITEPSDMGAMYECERCGKSLIDTVDLLLLLLIAVNLLFAILILMMGSWYGVGSFFLVFLFGAAFLIRRRECKACRDCTTPPKTQK